MQVTREGFQIWNQRKEQSCPLHHRTVVVIFIYCFITVVVMMILRIINGATFFLKYYFLYCQEKMCLVILSMNYPSFFFSFYLLKFYLVKATFYHLVLQLKILLLTCAIILHFRLGLVWKCLLIYWAVCIIRCVFFVTLKLVRD